MPKKKISLQRATLPSPEELRDFTRRPRSVCVYLLKEANWNSGRIVEFYAECMKPRYWRRIIGGSCTDFKIQAVLIERIGELFYYIGCYQRAIAANNWPQILFYAYEIGVVQGTLHGISGNIRNSRLGSRAAVEIKKQTAAEIHQMARLISADFFNREGNFPKKEHLWSLVMEE
jgi:hypothetical protein